jgi:hypothetical protein
MGTTYFALMLIEVMARSQQHARAAALTEEMIVFARTHDERIFEAELVRYRGVLGNDAASYREAIAIASASGAWTLALRAARSLGDPAELARIQARASG